LKDGRIVDNFILDTKNIGIKYSTLKDDIIDDFYVPVLGMSKKYDRATGYFSSSILLDYIRGLEEFVKNNGKMRLVISPFLSISDGYALINAANKKEQIKKSVTQMFTDYRASGDQYFTSGELLYKLIEENILDVRVVKPINENGLFHEKIGLFYDGAGNLLTINGSNNETSSAVNKNIESFTVMKSWNEALSPYCLEFKEEFENLWNGSGEGVETLNLKECVDKEVFQSYKTDKSFDELYDKLQGGISSSKKDSYEKKKLGFLPRDYQIEAAQKWISKKNGIISFATGTGKTKTAILCMEKYLEKNDRGIFLLVVPNKTLVNQWGDELSKIGFKSVRCFSESNNWNKSIKDLRNSWEVNLIDEFVMITTIDTFRTTKFQKQLNRIKDYVFISDECHRLATNSILKILPEVDWKLGLSATPVIYMAKDLTDRLLKYFGGIIGTYTLHDAIKNNLLVPYEYHPIIVKLTDKELEEYQKLSHKLVKMIGYDDENKMDHLSLEAQLVLFKRSRIIYGARKKLSKLDCLIDKISDLKYTLVYCGATRSDISDKDDQVEANGEKQLDSVNDLLHSKNIISAQYTKDENGSERIDRIEQFKKGNISTLVAIKCLDEGVDIPEIRTGIILASSGNPREYIQRRGRLLRKFPNKDKAILYDMVVYSNDDGYDSINKNELKRVYEYGKDSLNEQDVMDRYSSEFKRYGIVEDE